MALKDWNVKIGFSSSWYKKNDTIEIIPNHDSSGNISYIVEIFKWETISKNAKKISRPFKLRSQAIEFAKDYMRRH